MGITMGKIVSLEERGRLLIPKEFREDLKMKPGQKLVIEKHDDSIVVHKASDLKKFSEELKGCIKTSKIKPLEIKKIWGRS